MDQGILVESQIREGQELIDVLAENGVAVTAACWVKESDGGMWFLYLVTPLVGEGGSTGLAYRRINAVLRALPQSLGIDHFQIKAIGPSDAVGQAIRDFQRRYPNRPAWWYDGSSLGGVSIDAAYIYPPPVTTAAP